MANPRDHSMLGMPVSLDADVFISTPADQLSLGTRGKGNEQVIVLPAAATISADTGFEGSFVTPQDWVDGNEKVVGIAVLDGAPTTLVLAFGIQFATIAADGAYDAALGTERLFSEDTISEVDEDVYEFIIDVSAEAFTAGQLVDYFFFIDDGTHTYTGLILLKTLNFRRDTS